MSYKRSLQERLLALLLAGVAAFSAVPAAALAEAVDEATPQAAVVQDAGEESGAAKALDVEDAEDAASGNSAVKQASDEDADSSRQAEADPKQEEPAEGGSAANAGGSASTNTNAASEQRASDANDAATSAGQAGDNATALATAQLASDSPDTDPRISVNFELVGMDADGTDEVWSNSAQQVADGSNAAQLIEQALDAAGIAHTSTDPAVDGYYYLSDITSSDGRVLGWEESTGKYWQLFVNGEVSQVGADSVTLAPGDTVVLWYSAWGASIDDIGKATVKASMSFIGPDASGNNAVWAQATDTKVTAGTTAAELAVQLLGDAGLQYVSYGDGASFYLDSVTSADGRKLGWDQDTGKYWQLFVNGEVSQVGAGSVVLQPGDNVQWVYSVYGDEAPTDQIKVSCEVIGADADGNRQVWAQPTTASVAEGTTAAALSEQIWEGAGIVADTGTSSWGWYLNSLTSPTDPNVVLSTKQLDDSTWEYWQLFINGELAQVGAGGYTLKAGDTVSWVYGSDGFLPGHVSATAEVVGVDADGNAETWGTQTIQLVEGSTAADLSEALFAVAGIEADYGASSWGWMLNSITHDGKTYAWDQETGKYWHLYVNGEASSSMASGVTVKAGDKISWVYEADATPDPEPDPSPSPDPDDVWDSDWSGYSSADHVTDAKVPTADAEDKWSPVSLKDSTDWNTGISDPVLAGDYLFVAVGNKLLKKNVDTGETVEGGEAELDGSIDSTSRIVYTGGLILVPLSEGRLEAVNASTMAKAWVTDALPKGDHGAAQSLSSVAVRDGYAYFGTAEADWTTSYAGNLLCVRLSDGAVMWNQANETQSGYYWAGMAFFGDYGVVADDSGTVKVVDAATGSVVSSLKVADRVRTTVVTDGSCVYVVSNDGVLHKLTVGEDGSLAESGKVAFGFSSTSTPVLANGKIVVGGTSTECFTGGYQGRYEYHYGQIAVIDASTLTVEHAVNKADGSYIRQYGYDGGGDVKSCPVVSVQDGETYVYFTSNNEPGCVYRYRVGDDEAEVLYTPSTDGQNYCMASIVVGSDGALYYTNDSGKLFAIKGNGQRLRRFTVTFDANGKDASVPASQKVREGASAIEPATAPSCGGYTFLGWYIDAAGTTAWAFSDPVTGDMTLYAKWGKTASPNPGGDESGNDDNSNANGGNNGESGGDAGAESSNNKPAGLISLTSNGFATGVSSKSALAITMGAQPTTGAEETTEPSLLAGFASATATGMSTDDGELASASEGARGTADSEDSAAAGISGIPIWPFIGMGAAVAALIAVLAAKRRKEEE